MRILGIIIAVLFLTGCSNNNKTDLMTVILYPGSYRVYENNEQTESSIAFFDETNIKRAGIHGHIVFFTDSIGKYELKNCTVQKYKPIKCGGDGMYIAGKDIESGEYEILLNNGKDVGEINIYSNVKFHCYKDACLSETVTGSYEKTVKLENGQSVQIYGVTLIKKN